VGSLRHSEVGQERGSTRRLAERVVFGGRRALAGFAVAFCIGAVQAQDTALRFAAAGDVPYFVWEQLRFEQMLEAWNREELAFVLHVGDIKSGRDLCSGALYTQRRALFDRSAHPFILLPGDNDWTDCHRQSNGGFDPLERLALLRKVFYANNGTLGASPAELARHSTEFPEIVRWEHQGVVFVGLNVAGGHNGLRVSPASDAEYERRNTANLDWLASAFEHARMQRARAVVVAFHANPRFEAKAGSPAREGYDDLVAALEREAHAFGKPVAVIHGDTHHYRVDHPLPSTPNLVRMEVLGSPGVGWTRVTVTPGESPAFAFELVQ
jgi:hypothetical protein